MSKAQGLARVHFGQEVLENKVKKEGCDNVYNDMFYVVKFECL